MSAVRSHGRRFRPESRRPREHRARSVTRVGGTLSGSVTISNADPADGYFEWLVVTSATGGNGASGHRPVRPDRGGQLLLAKGAANGHDAALGQLLAQNRISITPKGNPPS